MLRKLYRLIVPESTRTWLRQRHRSWVLARGIRQLARDPEKYFESKDLNERLVYGWGNEGWSAGPEYLREAVKNALRGGDILECGSGLSTLVLGAVASRTGGSVFALEHIPSWRKLVIATAQRLPFARVPTVLEAPLRDYGGLRWYTIPPQLENRRFSLVLCDGPDNYPSRYGLLALLRSSLADDCVILFDDVECEEARQVLERWEREFRVSYTNKGEKKPYAVVRLALTPAAV
jgi:hypothetical protein